MFFPFFDKLKFKGYINAGSWHKRLVIDFPYRRARQVTQYMGDGRTRRILHLSRWYELQNAIAGVENKNLNYGYIEVRQKDPEKRGIFFTRERCSDKQQWDNWKVLYNVEHIKVPEFFE